MNEIEAMLDWVIGSYFSPMRHEGELQPLVLSRMSTRDKIEIVAQILDRLDVKDLFRVYVQLLRQASEFRNEVAHSYLGPNLEGITELNDQTRAALVDWHTIRASRTGRPIRRAEIEELRRWTRTIAHLKPHSVRAMVAVTDAGDTSPRSAVDGFDAMNPDLPPLV